MKKTLITTLAIMWLVIIASALMTGCGKSDWTEARGYPAMNGIPDKEPPTYLAPLGVKVYSEKVPTEKELQLVTQGVSEQLADSSKYTRSLGWSKYTKYSEYQVAILDGTYVAQSPDIRGCMLLETYGGTAIGTVMGVRLVNNRVSGPAIILVARQTNPECYTLFKNGVRHEAEHVRLINDTAFYNLLQGENDIHPIFELWEFKENHTAVRRDQ